MAADPSGNDPPGPDPSGGDAGEAPVADGFVAPADAAQYQAWPPASRTPATARGRWRMLALAAGGVAGSAALAVVCAAGLTFALRATDQDLSQPANAPTFPPVTAAPFSGVYSPTQDLCYGADFTHLRPLFNRVHVGGGEASTEPGTGVTTATCDGTAGNEQVEGEYRLEVSVFRDDTAAATAYGRVVAEHPGTAVSGVGQEAYTFVDPARGPMVTARDRNLTISMSWRGPDPTTGPETLVHTLAEVCRSSMVLLRFA